MKKNLATWLLACLCVGILTTLSACRDTIDDSTADQLQLSISERELLPTAEVMTNDTVYQFDVLKSKGMFKVKVNGGNSYVTPRVKVNGQHVTIGLLSEYTGVQVTDEAGQEISFHIHSAHADLKVQSYLYAVWYGCTFRYPDFKYGLGDMKVLSGNGNKGVAEVSFDKNNVLIVKSKRTGSSYFTVADGRGVTRWLQVAVEEGYDMTTDSLEVTSTNPSSLCFPIKYGKAGGWKLVKSTIPYVHDHVISPSNENVLCDYDLLYVYINYPYKNKQYKYYLENKDGSKGVVVVNVVEKKDK